MSDYAHFSYILIKDNKKIIYPVVDNGYGEEFISRFFWGIHHIFLRKWDREINIASDINNFEIDAKTDITSMYYSSKDIDLLSEGIAILDFNTKNLLFFCQSYTSKILLRNCLTILIQENWQDWTVSYAEHGVEDIFDYLRLEPIEFYIPELTEPIKNLPDKYYKLFYDPNPYAISSIITVKDINGNLKDYTTCIILAHLVVLGKNILTLLKTKEICNDINSYDENLDPEGYLFVDFTKKELWLGEIFIMGRKHKELLQSLWPDWKIFTHNEGLRYHFELTERSSDYIVNQSNYDFDKKEVLDTIHFIAFNNFKDNENYDVFKSKLNTYLKKINLIEEDIYY